MPPSLLELADGRCVRRWQQQQDTWGTAVGAGVAEVVRHEAVVPAAGAAVVPVGDGRDSSSRGEGRSRGGAAATRTAVRRSRVVGVFISPPVVISCSDFRLAVGGAIWIVSQGEYTPVSESKQAM